MYRPGFRAKAFCRRLDETILAQSYAIRPYLSMPPWYNKPLLLEDRLSILQDGGNEEMH